MKQALLRVIAAAALVLASLVAAGAQTGSIAVAPTSPRYMEPVYLLGTMTTSASLGGAFFIASRVSMQGSTIVVDYSWNIDLTTVSSIETLLGRFPTGTYDVRANLPTGTLTTTFTVGPNPPNDLLGGSHVPTVDYSGLWWNPAEPGWGMSIVQGPTNKIFAAWLTYDTSGNPTWYTFEPGGGQSSTFQGPIYKTTGPFFGIPFDPAQVTQVQVGTGTLEFQSHATGVFIFTVNGQSGVKDIQTQPLE